MKNNTTLIIALMLIALAYSSCSIPAHVAASRKVTKGFKDLAKNADDDVRDGALTDEIGNRIKKNYTTVIDDLNKDLEAIDQELNPFKKGKLKEDLLVKLRIYTRTIERLNKLYELDRFSTIKMNVFFGMGDYEIPEEDEPEVNEIIKPITDDIISVIGDSTAISMLTVIIVVSGHSDEAAIDTKSPLAKELGRTIESDNPSIQELNEELSSRRAKEFVRIIQNQLSKKGQYHDKIKFELNEVKRGYDKPYKLAYMNAVDDRRRVVTILWNVVPELLTK